MEVHSYEPLTVNAREFRLLIVSPGTYDENLQCTLRTVSFDDTCSPHYETISYCWGDVRMHETITVDGNPLQVPPSAAAALRRMRKPNRERVLWLDAICINQKDVAERSDQVTMMGDIYKYGVRNLIYLGEDDVSVPLASIAAIVKEISDSGDGLKRLRNDLGAWQYAKSGMSAEYDTKELIQFFSMPWFRRLWVVQEAALAKTNMCFCGSSTFDLLGVTRAAAWLLHNWYFVNAELRLQCSFAADMNDLVDEIHGHFSPKSGKTTSALYLLDLSQQRKATEAIDKVYGILGLTAGSEWSSLSMIKPDYGRDAATVFCEAAWCLIQDTKSLEVLDYVRHRSSGGEPQLDGFASWVPKWHEHKDLDEHPNFLSLSLDACLGRQVSFSTISETSNFISKNLAVEGIRVGIIQGATERFVASMNHDASSIKSFLDDTRAMSSPVGGKGSISRLARTLVAAVDLQYQPIQAGDGEVVAEYGAICGLIDSGNLPPDVSELTQDHDQTTARAAKYREAMWNACMNRRFFVLSNGQYGLAPHYIRSGDLVAVLYGLRFPAVLRAVDNGYCFLGTSYVDGIMHGEAVKKHVTLRASDESFSLC